MRTTSGGPNVTLRSHANPDVTCALLLASFITRVVCITVHALTRMMLGDVTAEQPAQGLITRTEMYCIET
jgi:hypothetical protein